MPHYEAKSKDKAREAGHAKVHSKANVRNEAKSKGESGKIERQSMPGDVMSKEVGRLEGR
jgi:hypothetical protein